MEIPRLIKTFAQEPDLFAALEKSGLTLQQARDALTSDEGHAQCQAFLDLARIHVELLAHNHAGQAVGKLAAIAYSDAKPEVQLRSAQSLLKVAGLDHKKPRPEKPAEDSSAMPDPPHDNPILNTALKLSAQMHAAQQIKLHMDPPPPKPAVSDGAG